MVTLTGQGTLLTFSACIPNSLHSEMDIQTVKDVTNTALDMRGRSHNGSYTLVDQRPWEHQSKLSTLFDKDQ